MEYIYAALLLHKLKKEISEENLKKVVEAAGINPDEVKVKSLISALSEVDIDDALKTAMVSAVAAQPSAAAPAVSSEAVKEKPEDTKVEEKKEEEALSGLSTLFG